MSSNDFDLIPQPPDPTYVKLVAAAIRWLIQILSGFGFAWGAFSDSQITMTAMAIVSIATLIWSFSQKLRSIHHARQMAIASALKTAQATAKAGEPTPIAITNKQQAQAAVQEMVRGPSL